MDFENTPYHASPEPGPMRSDIKDTKPKSKWPSFFSSLTIVILAPIVAILLTSFVLQSYEVQGRSMESTLTDQDRLIIWKMPKTVAKVTGNKYIPQRYEVIVFSQPGLSDGNKDKQLIKRVIGLPGDRVVVSGNQITIYNSQNPQGYNPDENQTFTPNIAKPTKGNIELTVPNGEVFVSGDNRTDSYDSRDFGTVSSEAVIGKLAFKILPLSKFERF